MYRGAGPGLEPESVPGTGQAASPQEGVLGLFPELGGSTAGVSMREKLPSLCWPDPVQQRVPSLPLLLVLETDVPWIGHPKRPLSL